MCQVDYRWLLACVDQLTRGICRIFGSVALSLFGLVIKLLSYIFHRFVRIVRMILVERLHINSGIIHN